MNRTGMLIAPLLRAFCFRRSVKFSQSLNDVASAQQQVLARIVQASATTDYGRSIGLSASGDIDEFRSRVPLVDYSTVQPWIERQRDGNHSIISPRNVQSYEPTSGSSNAVKWIPYNDAMLKSFRSMFAIWAYDLLTQRLRPRSGRIFMSISSPVQADGFKDDREYLGALFRFLIGRFLVAPPALGPQPHLETFRDKLIVELINHADLEIVSIWNPSYLLILLDHFEKHRDRLLPAVTPKRRKLVNIGSLCWHEVWPDLQLISCWTEAAAAIPANRLAAMFPQATLQGKGLLATEAPITVPLMAVGGCVPLIDEIFIELEDNDGHQHLLQNVQTNVEYTVIVTQPGGLLRYRLGDRVRVTGYYHNTPLLQFIGRAGAVSDLVGEKIDEDFVAQVLQNTAGDAFYVLLPVFPANDRPYYCLLTDGPHLALADIVESLLLQSFRYSEARSLGQLDAVQVIVSTNMRMKVHDALSSSGFKVGNIKDRALIPSIELAQKVHAYVLST